MLLFEDDGSTREITVGEMILLGRSRDLFELIQHKLAVDGFYGRPSDKMILKRPDKMDNYITDAFGEDWQEKPEVREYIARSLRDIFRYINPNIFDGNGKSKEDIDEEINDMIDSYVKEAS